MAWLEELFQGTSVAASLLLLGLVSAAGMAAGSIRVRGARLGAAGVLFAGLVFGHFHLTVTPPVLEFVRDFGLVLFVYSIGIQVGPGFLASLRREGIPLNLMAATVVILGAFLTVAISFFGRIDMAVAAGLFSGATTNTPSLAAAQSAIMELSRYTEEVRLLPGLGYAVAYPFGVLGVILTMLFIRVAFRIDRKQEAQAFLAAQAEGTSCLMRMNIEVRNPNLEGLTLADIALLQTSGVVISRILHGEVLSLAHPGTPLRQGDVLLAVGSAERLKQLQVALGRQSRIDLLSLPTDLVTQRIVVTRKKVLGKSIEDLGLLERYGVRITRLRRAENEMAASPGLRLHYGDAVQAVGSPDAVSRAEEILGNSIKKLQHPELAPVFIGVILGVLVGSCPIAIPGIPVPVKLGLAGGPLLVAIVLSRMGRIGPLVWYLPASANLMIRELGISLFLACVGLKAGDRFVATLLHGDGFYWMGMAALITLIPAVLVSLFARLALRMNYMSLCGLLAGSMTDPPALAFACSTNDSESPMIAYATVYPLTMILRVVFAQLMVLAFM
ncbi:MAG TPA: putative transporter [Candidatus Hydrogenedentes bacterium]|nr:putative transporter [Candidatus Hydrogenedentota bacterium]